MAKVQPPELKRYLDKRLALKLNANRSVTGVLRGFDVFMNLVLDDASEDVSPTEKLRLGMAVRGRACRARQGGGWDGATARVGGAPPTTGSLCHSLAQPSGDRGRRSPPPHPVVHTLPLLRSPPSPAEALQVIRGNSIIQLECLDRIPG